MTNTKVMIFCPTVRNTISIYTKKMLNISKEKKGPSSAKKLCGIRRHKES